jgi:hypothetical protein
VSLAETIPAVVIAIDDGLRNNWAL